MCWRWSSVLQLDIFRHPELVKFRIKLILQIRRSFWAFDLLTRSSDILYEGLIKCCCIFLIHGTSVCSHKPLSGIPSKVYRKLDPSSFVKNWLKHVAHPFHKLFWGVKSVKFFTAELLRFNPFQFGHCPPSWIWPKWISTHYSSASPYCLLIF